MTQELLPFFDLNGTDGEATMQHRIEQLRPPVASDAEAAKVVAEIVEDVRQHGDEALGKYMRKWTDPAFDVTRIRVSEEELAQAVRDTDDALCDALKQAIDNVRQYQSHLVPQAPAPLQLDGAELGLRFSPVDSVGLAVPGGRAVYPSSVIMQAIPAQVAGVPDDGICVVTPPPTRREGEEARDVAQLVLAACELCGVRRVYRIGGAQAIAALAFGTETVQPVDMVVGPGNTFVQLAKSQLSGVIGTDGYYGPSEILVVADESANAAYVAADLIAQAEHDPGKCFLVSWSRPAIDAITEQLAKQLAERDRAEPLRRALADESCAVLVRDSEQALDVANRLAAEHVSLAVQDPDALLPGLKHAGEILIGDETPVAAGDYWAGPSHCLPTGVTARFSSGLSPYTFLKRTGTIRYRNGVPAASRAAMAALARAEGLDGHAATALIRDDS